MTNWVYMNEEKLIEFAAVAGIEIAAINERYGCGEATAWGLIPDLKTSARAEYIARYLKNHDMIDVYHAWIDGPEVSEE